MRNLICRVLGRGAHRELIHIRFTDHDNTLLVEFCHDSRIVWRHKVFKDFRTAGRPYTFGTYYIFNRDRDTRERWHLVAILKSRVGMTRLLQGDVLRQRQVAFNMRFHFSNTRIDRFNQRYSGDFPIFEFLVQGMCRQFVKHF